MLACMHRTATKQTISAVSRFSSTAAAAATTNDRMGPTSTATRATIATPMLLNSFKSVRSTRPRISRLQVRAVVNGTTAVACSTPLTFDEGGDDNDDTTDTDVPAPSYKLSHPKVILVYDVSALHVLTGSPERDYQSASLQETKFECSWCWNTSLCHSLVAESHEYTDTRSYWIRWCGGYWYQ